MGTPQSFRSKRATRRWVSLSTVFRWFAIAHLVVGCSSEATKTGDTLFELIEPSASGVHFENRLTFSNEFNIYTYRNYYNGGGVALGDVNNDGLIDIYFTGNMVPNKLYLNKGNFQFEDITERAGVAGSKFWSTGVTMADVNGDGWLDIYVCNSGPTSADRHNELFINNGDLTFTEQAALYNVADPGFAIHASFFDYDRDGDLDLYILNNSYQPIGSFNLRKNERDKRDSLGGDKLLRNDGDTFTDVSAEAGIYGSAIGFGLGVSVGDVNGDGWFDIYISNDFFERDYLYINNQDGTFSEQLTDWIKSISISSMGADIADIDNDLDVDIFVTEMLPGDDERLKTVTTFEDWNRYQYNIQNNYHHQFTRNMLQLNNGDSTFSEVGRLAGVEATDWSWGALFFDMDNDGWKDVFVANGIFQDITNQDFLEFASNEEFVKSMVSNRTVDYKRLTEIIPSTPISNYAFYNARGLTFINKAEEWGLDKPCFSNGSAYGDLDNDGDLDLVMNNVNMPAFIYRNHADRLFPEHNFLKIVLKGRAPNTSAIGSKVTVKAGGREFYLEQVPIRGFQSTVDSRLNFGLGDVDTLDQVIVTWPDGRITELRSVAANQILELDQNDAVAHGSDELKSGVERARLFDDVSNGLGIQYRHVESDYVDFNRDQLIFHMISSEGPRLSTGDVNGDGLTDIYIGGARGVAGSLFIQLRDGSFQPTNKDVFEQDKLSEDLGSAFVDVDGDGDLDLYVCSGSSEFSPSSRALVDRLYINDGRGSFTRSPQVLPTLRFESTSCVASADYDNDGDQDLFVGVRMQPLSYGMPGNGYILQNDGRGNFSNVSREAAPDLANIGMITDAVWADIDRDGDDDLLVVGEYMTVTVFVNEGGKLVNRTEQAGLAESQGWWNRIIAADLDGDGDVDFVLGNHGLNSRFKAAPDRPIRMYVSDFDQNGTIEQIICRYEGDKSYPMVLRHDLVRQIPSLKKKYLKYESYKGQSIEDMFSSDQLAKSVTLEARVMESSVLINDGKGAFELRPLPLEAQLAPVYAIAANDFDGDGITDIVLGGNLYRVKPEVGRYDASRGLFLKGRGDGTFDAWPARRSGIHIDGELRDFAVTRIGKELVLLGVRNSDSLIAYRLSGR
ncbi:MAG: VCBS repeat-containing protein [Bacteroidota bacterium]|nr:MAG: hypothetical protein DIU61_15475 [Bacteroidota bacterium]